MPGRTDWAPYRIYEHALLNASRGLPLWDPLPSPISTCERAWPGQVGYIERGRFKLLFDAGQQLGSRVRGKDVPDEFELPVDLGDIDLGTPLSADEPVMFGLEESCGVKGEVKPAIHLMSAGAKASFSATEDKGAQFFSRGRTFRRDTNNTEHCRQYMKANYKSWLEFGKKKGRPISLDNLVFVTGVDLARDFHVLAYRKLDTKASLSLSISVPSAISTGANLWKKSQSDSIVYEVHGPGEEGMPPPPDRARILQNTAAKDHKELLRSRQCIFLRRIIAQDRIFWVQMKAAAGPHRLPSQDSSESDTSNAIHALEAATEVAVFDPDLPPAFEEPLQPCFDYIFTCSEAKLAIVHDIEYASLLSRAVSHGCVLNCLGDYHATGQRQIVTINVEDVFRVLKPEVYVDEDGVGALVTDETIARWLDSRADDKILRLVARLGGNPLLRKQFQELDQERAQRVYQVLQTWLDYPSNHQHPERSPVIHWLAYMAHIRGDLPCHLIIDGIKREPHTSAMGSFSDVYRGRMDDTNVAVRHERQLGNERSRLIYHALLWRQFRHDHILQLTGITGTQPPSLVSPWASRGNLMMFSQTEEYEASKDLRGLLSEICEGLAYIHRQGFVHGDITPRTVLVTQDTKIKLAGFHFLDYAAKPEWDGERVEGFNTGFASPQVLEDDKHCRSPEDDIFSLGCLIHYLVTKQNPNSGHSQVQWIMKIVRGERPTRPSPEACRGLHISDQFWALITRCWKQDPIHRPDIDTVANVLSDIQLFV